MYVCYPDSFVDKNGKKDFETLTDQITYLKKIGINAIHVLPFFESPMIDMGFDVADYMSVREDLGGNKAFDKFLAKCKKLSKI
jgi:glycosidase